MNIVPAIATTYYESIAVIVLAGAGATHWFDRGGMEEAYRSGPEDWVAVLKPITKKSFMVTRPDNVLDMFLRALPYRHFGASRAGRYSNPFDIQNTLIDDTLPDPTPWTQWHPLRPTRTASRMQLPSGAALRPLVVVVAYP